MSRRPAAASRALAAVAVLALLAPVAPLAAQQSRGSMELIPYAGYMFSGNALEGPFGTSLSNGAGALYGAQLALRILPGVALVGNLGYSAPDVRAGVPIFGDVRVGRSSLWIYDGGVQLSLPARGEPAPSITPFVQGGVGAMQYSVSSGPVTGKANNLAWNVGAGVDVALVRGVGVRLFAKDHIGRFDFRDATGLDVTGETVHHVALGLGLRLEF